MFNAVTVPVPLVKKLRFLRFRFRFRFHNTASNVPKRYLSTLAKVLCKTLNIEKK
jgi:hypothetical protein